MIPVYFFEDKQTEHKTLMEKCAEDWFGTEADREQENHIERKEMEKFSAGGHPWEIRKSDKGKPFFRFAGEKGVSFSDSGNACVVALAEGQIGVDLQFFAQQLRNPADPDAVEKRSEKLLGLARRFFHAEEKEFVERAETAEEIFRCFMIIWTAKESYVKFTGRGIDANFSEFSVLPANKSIENMENSNRDGLLREHLQWAAQGAFFSVLLCGRRLGEKYAICVCAERADQVFLRSRDALFLDLDGTILYGGRPISHANRQALERAVKAGLRVVIASGRPFTALPDSVLEIPGISYAITSNGSAIYDMQSKKKIREVLLTPQSVEWILEKTEKLWHTGEVACELFINGQAYTMAEYREDPMAYGAGMTAKAYVQKSRIVVADLRSFILEHRDEISGIDFMTANASLRRELREMFAEKVSLSGKKAPMAEEKRLYVTSSVSNRVELANAAAGKKSAMEYLLHLWHIPRERAVAFGDADNDAELLGAAGLGLAVSNGTEECRKAADRVIPSVEQDGFAWAVRYELGI